MTATFNPIVRKFTRSWLSKQSNFFAICYYDNDKVNLWSVLDFYVELISEGNAHCDTLDAIFSEYPNLSDEISFEKSNSFEKLRTRIEGSQSLVFLDGELFESEGDRPTLYDAMIERTKQLQADARKKLEEGGDRHG